MHRGDHVGMVAPEREHPVAGDQIEITPTLGIDQMRSVAADPGPVEPERAQDAPHLRVEITILRVISSPARRDSSAAIVGISFTAKRRPPSAVDAIDDLHRAARRRVLEGGSRCRRSATAPAAPRALPRQRQHDQVEFVQRPEGAASLYRARAALDGCCRRLHRPPSESPSCSMPRSKPVPPALHQPAPWCPDSRRGSPGREAVRRETINQTIPGSPRGDLRGAHRAGGDGRLQMVQPLPRQRCRAQDREPLRQDTGGQVRQQGVLRLQHLPRLPRRHPPPT